MNYLTAMRELGINANDCMFLDCIRQADYDSAKECIVLNKTAQEDIDALLDSGLLTSIAPSGYDLTKMRTASKFDAFFNSDDESSEKFDEFLAAYPRFLYINGKRVAALNADMDELEEEYVKKVVKKGKHEDVMTALNWARENHEIHMGIKLWFSSRQWLSIAEIMNDARGSRLPSNNLL